MTDKYTPQDLQDNLDYLNETKRQIKQALIDKEQQVTDTDTFRSYADKIRAITSGVNTETFYSLEEMHSAKLNEGTICKIVKEGNFKQPLTEATNIKSIFLNNILKMENTSTNPTATRWESVDGTEYFQISKPTGIVGMLNPSRKVITYYSNIEGTTRTITYKHNGEYYEADTLSAPQVLEFSNPLTLTAGGINHREVASLIYAITPVEVLMHIFEYKENQFIPLLDNVRHYTSIEELEADATAEGMIGIVYDKENNLLLGIYETDEIGWKAITAQLNISADSVAPGYIGLGPTGLVEGTFTTDATATANDIIEGTTAYINGKKVSGAIQSTYITTDGVASPLYENAWTGNTSFRTMAFSHKFGVALLRTTTTQKTESLRIAKVNKTTGAYSITSSSYDITNSKLIGYTGYSFVGADIAHQLNEDGTLRMAFVLSTLDTSVYSRDSYIVACDYDLSTYSIKKIYKPSFGAVDLTYFDRNINASPVYFSPTNKDVFLVLDEVSSGKYTIPGWLEESKCPLCFIQENGDILLRSCLDNSSGDSVCTQRIAWSPNGSRMWYNATSLYACTNNTNTSYTEGYMSTINYESTSVTTTKYAKAAYGYMVFLNENTLFELRYNKNYNIYTINGTTLTKIKSGTVNMNIYYKTGSNTQYQSVSELRCVDNNIFYVDARNFYCITLDDEYNVSKVQALDSKYCCLEFPQKESPWINRKCLVTKVEDDKYIHCSDVNQYYAVFQITGDKVIETINKDGVTLHNTSSATATSSNILINKSAYIGEGKTTGTMPNNGAKIITPGDSQIAIPAGYHNGSGYVKAMDITTSAEYTECLDLSNQILGGA